MPRLTHLPIEELDLRLAHSGTVLVERMNAVPGFRTSAAFFTFLRQNLVLPPSTLNSPYSTPHLYPSSSQTLPPLLPSSLATMTSTDAILPTNPLDEIPPLSTHILTAESDKVDALKLVADSIAQQRQLGSKAVILHPATIAGYVVVLAITTRLLYKQPDDIGIVGTTCAGITMILLVLVRMLTAGFLAQAESFTWQFARNDAGEEDTIIGSKYGEDLIGALVLRLERNGGKKKKSGGKGMVRAWTTKLRYRGKGVGTEMLEQAVRVTRDTLGNSAEIGFAAEHANSKMVLPEMFNGDFRKREAKAARALEAVVEGTKRR